ncbi:MAG: hypothetical protein NTX50_25800 [Candidatus Sumerlaeota bacterium]|nr:hypothetical protein [Candidatus Sumerlaeota bacterium]
MKLSHAVLILMASLMWGGCSSMRRPAYEMMERSITVDGKVDDWAGVKANGVSDAKHLWCGLGLTGDKWEGPKDLSYSWRGAWSGDKLYLLIQVNDDKVVAPASQELPSQCDCVEICVDYENRGGQRIKIMDGRADWMAKFDKKEMMGLNLEFLPTEPAKAYLDHTNKYAIDKPQNEDFTRDWNGEISVKKHPTGYYMELGFSIPEVKMKEGKAIGLEIAVCDDDGQGRKSIMTWTGSQDKYWLTMDGYKKVKLTRKAEK